MDLGGCAGGFGVGVGECVGAFGGRMDIWEVKYTLIKSITLQRTPIGVRPARLDIQRHICPVRRPAERVSRALCPSCGGDAAAFWGRIGELVGGGEGEAEEGG